MKKLYILALLAAGLPSMGQTVSFTQTPLGGSTAYNPCVVDMNGDYLDDVVSVGTNQLKVWKQQASGGFVLSTYAVTGLGLGFASPDWSVAAGDFDANGYCDLVLGNGSRVSVLKANADGTGYALSSYPQNIFTQRTNFVDIDNDGNLDLWACHDVAQSHAYRNDGAGNLVFDTTLMPTLAVGGNYASIWADIDSDGHIDMYLAKCRAGAPVNDPQRVNLYYHNNGNGTYTEMAAAAGINDGSQSWSTAVEDFDNDGDMDLLLSNVGSSEGNDHNKFYRNNGDGTFTDIYATTGIQDVVGSWELQAADFNNDGFVDFLWENSTNLYLNNGDNTFTGYDLPFGQGAFGDLNNDGFMDVQTGNNIYMNDGNANKWVKVTLEGNESNLEGIGARVEIYGAWGKQIRDIRSGQGFSNMSTLNAHFGIGSATAITKVVVRWPSGIVDEILNPSTNSTVHVVEGTSPPLSVEQSAVAAFTISPNPTKDMLFLTKGSELFNGAKAEVFDLGGRSVMHADVNGSILSVSKLSIGTYVLKLTDANGNVFTQKFIKE
ncbi:FG-GAP-like repeat-containing protein [Flavobacterium silvaticum]|uniref:T9SS type A sorting domain-containing protein n=1 Tax=Flavobacterium silvaticum TaxID=1852020 RepID=A0A972JFM3_9FLAO|nr:FG-GAP-like repeat-containing protein [Flavobacterium silvaticum]NMH28124.1 T9SS type A sorting domain-containing protein [Flavobacterium silvaticum]